MDYWKVMNTESSRIMEGRGAAVFGPKRKYYRSLGAYAISFQTEAKQKCVQFNLDREYHSELIVFQPDSITTIMALSSNVIRSSLVRDGALVTGYRAI